MPETKKVLAMLISFVRTKVDGSGNIIDERTRSEVKQLMSDFVRCLS